MTGQASTTTSRASGDRFPSGTVSPAEADGILTSNLLKLDPVLTQVARGKKVLHVSQRYMKVQDHVGHHIDKLQTALKIIRGIDEATWPANMHMDFDESMHNYLKAFKMSEPDLGDDGFLDAPTILKIDSILTEIFFYDIESATIVHDARTAVYIGAYTAVTDDIALKTRPDSSSPPLTIGGVPETIEKGSAVYLVHVLDNKTWFYVETTGGIQGYLPLSKVWINSIMPDPRATLFHTGQTPGETMETIIRNHITNERSDIVNPNLNEDKWRFYALVTVRFNNPAGVQNKKNKRLNLDSGLYDIEETIPAGVYLQNPGDWDPYKDIYGIPGQEHSLEQTVQKRCYEFYKAHIDGWDNIHNVKLVPNKFIWLPSIRYVEGLYAQMVAGSQGTNASIISYLKNAANDYFQDFKTRLDNSWKVGFGVRLDAAVGATFGIPVGLDADYYFAMWRESDTIVRAVRRGTLSGGLDIGVGAGFFISGSNDKGKLYEEKNNYFGAGAQAGVQFQAGVKILVHQEMEFHLDSDLAVAALLMTALQVEMSTDALVRMFVMLLKMNDIDPNDYTTVLKGELGEYARGTGAAGISLGFLDKSGQNFSNSYWTNVDKKQDLRKGLAPSWWSLLSLLSFQLGVDASVEFAAGIKITHDNFDYDPVTGFRLPEKSNLELYADLETGVGANISIFSFIPSYPTGLAIGLGAKAVFEFTYAQAEFDDDPATKEGFKFKGLTVYTKSGDTDIYLGPAHDIELGLNLDQVALKNLDPNNPGSFFANMAAQPIQDYFKDVKIRKIAGLGTIYNSGLFEKGISASTFFGKEKFLNVLVKHTSADNLKSFKDIYKATKRGFNLVALLDIEYRPPMGMLKAFLIDLYQDIRSDPTFQIEDIPQILLSLHPGTMPEKYKKSICRIIEKSEMPSAILHGEFGLTLAIGIHAAKGAKVRIRLKGGMNIVFHLDIINAIEVWLREEEFDTDVKSFLKSFFIAPPSQDATVIVESGSLQKGS